MFIYFERERERKRERECTGKWQREREREWERENFKQNFCTSAEPDVGLDLTKCEIMTWAEIKSQTLNQLRHPSESIFKFCSMWSLVSRLPFEPSPPFVGEDGSAHGPCLCLNIFPLLESFQNVSGMLSLFACLYLLIHLHSALVISMTINL